LSKRKNPTRDDEVPQRRRFLQTSFLGSVSAAMLPALAGAREIASPAGHAAEVRPFELDEVTVADLEAGLASGKFTARSLTEKYLVRIEEIDRSGPALNSVIEINPDALSVAERLDKEQKSQGAPGPLHGIPVLIKDNIDTADRMQTTAGSLALMGSRPTRDAFVAQKLRAAGGLSWAKPI
jgi:amidase